MSRFPAPGRHEVDVTHGAIVMSVPSDAASRRADGVSHRSNAGQYRSDAALRRAQALSGVIFGTFLAVHLANTWIAVISAEHYDATQRILRAVYQKPLVEAVLLATLGVHLGVAILRKRTGRPAPQTARTRWHRNAGIFLAIVIAGHILAVRGPSWFAGIHPGFAGMSFTLAWLPEYFYPYYFLLGTAGLYHGLHGLGVAAARFGWRLRVSARTAWCATAAGAIALVLALLGFGGVWYEIADPFDNDFTRLVTGIAGGKTP
jgi:succinate dehydrogenase/fumarate reductase cytochrome b subunit